MSFDNSINILILKLTVKTQRLRSHRKIKGTRCESYLLRIQTHLTSLRGLWANANYPFYELMHDIGSPIASMNVAYLLLLRVLPRDLAIVLKAPLEELRLYIEYLIYKREYLRESYQYEENTVNQPVWEAIIDFEGAALIDLFISKIVSLRLQDAWKSKDWHLAQLHHHMIELNRCWQTMENPNRHQRTLIKLLMDMIAHSFSMMEYELDNAERVAIAPLQKISDILQQKLILLEIRAQTV